MDYICAHLARSLMYPGRNREKRRCAPSTKLRVDQDMRRKKIGAEQGTIDYALNNTSC